MIITLIINLVGISLGIGIATCCTALCLLKHDDTNSRQ